MKSIACAYSQSDKLVDHDSMYPSDKFYCWFKATVVFVFFFFLVFYEFNKCERTGGTGPTNKTRTSSTDEMS